MCILQTKIKAVLVFLAFLFLYFVGNSCSNWYFPHRKEFRNTWCDHCQGSHAEAARTLIVSMLTERLQPDVITMNSAIGANLEKSFFLLHFFEGGWNFWCQKSKGPVCSLQLEISWWDVSRAVPVRCQSWWLVCGSSVSQRVTWSHCTECWKCPQGGFHCRDGGWGGELFFSHTVCFIEGLWRFWTNLLLLMKSHRSVVWNLVCKLQEQRVERTDDELRILSWWVCEGPFLFSAMAARATSRGAMSVASLGVALWVSISSAVLWQRSRGIFTTISCHQCGRSHHCLQFGILCKGGTMMGCDERDKQKPWGALALPKLTLLFVSRFTRIGLAVFRSVVVALPVFRWTWFMAYWKIFRCQILCHKLRWLPHS